MSFQTVPLGSVCHVVGGGTPSKANRAYYDGDIPWATVRDMRSDVIFETECRISRQAVRDSATNILPAGTVVIATRVGLGKVSIVGQSTAINQDLRGIVPKHAGEIEPRFLFWWLKSVAHLFVAAGTGATVQGVKVPFVTSLPFPAVPIAEQRRIVGVLNEAFEGIAIAEANANRTSAAIGALEGGILDKAVADAAGLASSVPLEQVCRRITVGHVGPMMERYTESGIPFLRSQNVRPFELDLRSVKFIDQAFDSELQKSRLRPGDVAIVRTGYPGIASVIPDDLPVSNCADLVIATPSDRLDADFLALFLNSPTGRSLVDGNLTGAAQKHFNVGAAKRATIPVPSREQQRSIVVTTSEARRECRSCRELQGRKLAALDELKKSLLARAFSGELTREPLAA